MAQLTCPRCGAGYPAGTANCRMDFAVLVPDPEAAPATADAGTTAGPRPATCAACGADRPDGTITCDFCGAAADSSAPTSVALRLLGPWGEIVIGSEPVQIGRESPTPAIAAALAQFDVVSRHHAQIGVRDDRTWLTDVGSANGTYLNGRRLDPRTPVPVTAGDVVRLGSSVQLELGGPDG